MEPIVRLLETYRGRDKIIRLCGYASALIAGNIGGNTAVKLATITKELGRCRMILRLFDDLPMLASNLMYGFGSKVNTSS